MSVNLGRIVVAKKKGLQWRGLGRAVEPESDFTCGDAKQEWLLS